MYWMPWIIGVVIAIRSIVAAVNRKTERNFMKLDRSWIVHRNYAILLTLMDFAYCASVASKLYVDRSIVGPFVEMVLHSTDLDGFLLIFPYHKLLSMIFYSEPDTLP